MDQDLELLLRGPRQEDGDIAAQLVKAAAAAQDDEPQLPAVPDGMVAVPVEAMTPSQIQGKLLQSATEAIDRSAEALNTVLQELQASPGDIQTILGASNLIKAHASLIAQLNKVNEVNAKIVHNERMAAVKAGVQKAINDDNIEARERMMSRKDMQNGL